MKDESSIYDAEPEDLDQLVFDIMGGSEAEDASASEATLEGTIEHLGSRIGRYKLLSILGEGGIVVVEHDSSDNTPKNINGLIKSDERTYGGTTISFYELED